MVAVEQNHSRHMEYSVSFLVLAREPEALEGHLEDANDLPDCNDFPTNSEKNMHRSS